MILIITEINFCYDLSVLFLYSKSYLVPSKEVGCLERGYSFKQRLRTSVVENLRIVMLKGTIRAYIQVREDNKVYIFLKVKCKYCR